MMSVNKICLMIYCIFFGKNFGEFKRKERMMIKKNGKRNRKSTLRVVEITFLVSQRSIIAPRVGERELRVSLL